MLRVVSICLVATFVCAGCVGSPTFVSDSKTGKPIADQWQEVNVADFSISLPPGWVHEKGAGIDSAFGNFKGDGILLCYNLGMNPWRLSGIKDSVEENLMVGGKEARLVIGGEKNVAGIYFKNVIKELSFNLVIYGLNLTTDQQKLVVQILKTIKFKE